MLITRKNITQKKKRNSADIKNQKSRKCMSVYKMFSSIRSLLVQHFEIALPQNEAT